MKTKAVQCKVNNYFVYIAISFVLLPFSILCSLAVHKKESLKSNDYGLMSTIPTDDDYPYCWYLDQIEAEKAWDITTGSSGISVNIIDSGINYNQASLQQFTELNSNVNANDSIEVCTNSTEGPFFDFASYLSLNGHGTRVASLIGAQANNDEGACGIAWDVDMLSIKSSCANSGIDFLEIKTVFDSNSSNFRGYVPITNMSIGIKISNNYQYNYYHCGDLLSSLNTYSGLIVVSSGNESKNLDSSADQVYPACFDLANMIVVGASTTSDEKRSNSNFGQNTVDLFAPGEGLWTPGFSVDYNGNQVFLGMDDDFSGTSAAAPLVAGTAALMKSVNPNLTTAQLKSLIVNNVDPISSLADKCVSGGRLNTYKAVKAAIPEITTFNNYVNGIQPLPSGKHQFYKIVLPAGTYTFETSGNLYTSGYLYGDIQSSPIASSTNQSGNFSFSFYAFKNRTVYLKVVNNSSTSGTYSLKITPSHSHSYTYSYSNFDGYYHKAYCSCGLYQLKPHIAAPNNICVMCGGLYTGPMSSPLSDPVLVGNDSHILTNGTILLGNIDYNLYLLGELDLDSLIEGETI